MSPREPVGTDAATYLRGLHGEMQDWRRDFHANPELGYEEFRTSGIVASKLEEWGVEVHRGLGKTGVVGVVKGQPGAGAIGLRADMDALAMQERGDAEYRSTIPDRMHACGHDGHTAMLLGAAKYLAATRRFSGTVNLIFQPAEEGLAGAKAMLDDGLFDRFPCDGVYGVHNDPETPLGRAILRAGVMLAAVDYFVVRIVGKRSHVAQPHRGVDPIVAAGHVLVALQSIVSRRVDPLESAVISVGLIHGGTHNLVIPDVVEFQGSVRTLDPASCASLRAWFIETVESTARAHGATAEIDYRTAYPATVNSPDETRIAGAVLRETLGDRSIVADGRPWTAGEDFGFLLQQQPGAYAFLGQRTATRGGVPLHSVEYDFNDDLLPLGATYFAHLAERILAPDRPAA